MQALRQRVRPKHQVLILKCYPRLSKNSAVDEIRPNGSELSYLLYYASSRRSKVSKVGAFLEHRTANDLSKARTTSVQITLLILTAFLNNPAIGGAGPAGFDLFASFVLRMLKDILQRPSEPVLVEDALPTWDAFCTHQDHVLLSADADYRELFGEVVRLWAGFATRARPEDRKRGILRSARIGVGVGDAIRLRTAGLQALKSLSDSDTLGAESGQQLEILIPVLLKTLHGHDSDLDALLEKQTQNEAQDKERTNKSRPSMAVSRPTFESVNPRAAEGTAADADKLADREADLLALQCLKSIYTVENRGQIRAATIYLLRHVMDQDVMPLEIDKDASESHYMWSIKLLETACGWIPVQDRFVALFVAAQTLVSGLLDAKDFRGSLTRHVLLSRLIAHVLGSDVYFIGISVMDLMLGFVQCVLRILQPAQAHDIDGALTGPSSTATSLTASAPRKRSLDPEVDTLLKNLRQCITNLATHVYYTDQISDMISAILLRIKSPSAAANTSEFASTISGDEADSNATDIAIDAQSKERAHVNGFFSFESARRTALDAVRDIMIVANSGVAHIGYVADNRNTVPVGVWEGTHWLLRDSSIKVRQSYVDAMCTWLTQELRISDARPEPEESVDPGTVRFDPPDTLRRHASETLLNSKAKTSNARFLQILHIAIYDNMMHYLDQPGSDIDLVLMFQLLTTLSKTFGFEAVRINFPMIMSVQDNLSSLKSPDGSIKASNLVYGFLWALCDIFGFRESAVGQLIDEEVAKRKSLQVWTPGLELPPITSERLGANGDQTKTAPELKSMDRLTLFTRRSEFVKQLTSACLNASRSPPGSTPSSPVRATFLPVLSAMPSSPVRANFLPVQSADTPNQPSRRKSQDVDRLSQPMIDDLSATWSKDMALSELDNVFRTASFSSFTGIVSTRAKSRPASTIIKDYIVATHDHRHLLAAAAAVNNLSGNRLRPYSHDGSSRASAQGDAGSGRYSAAGSINKARSASRILPSQSSRQSMSPDEHLRGTAKFSGSTSPGLHRHSAESRGSVVQTGAVKVVDLKRVLAVGGGAVITLSEAGSRASRSHYYDNDDTGSDSQMDVDESFGAFGYDEEDEEIDNEHKVSTFQGVNNLEHVEEKDFAGTTVDTESANDFKTPPETHEQLHVQKVRAEQRNGVQAATDNAADRDTAADASVIRWVSGQATDAAIINQVFEDATQSQSAAEMEATDQRSHREGTYKNQQLKSSRPPTQASQNPNEQDSRTQRTSSNLEASASNSAMADHLSPKSRVTSQSTTQRRHVSNASSSATNRKKDSPYQRHVFSSPAGSMLSSAQSSQRSSSVDLINLLASVKVDDDERLGGRDHVGASRSGLQAMEPPY